MFDGSALPLEENLEIAPSCSTQCAEADIILEVECGVVGGEEDGVSGEDAPREKLYTTPEDMLRVAEVLGTGERGRYLLAATFGNVHGVYAPGSVTLRPKVLQDGQKALAERYGPGVSFDYVFHGGSGSEPEKIAEAVSYGVVKMNVDTDTQYAYTRPIAGHMLASYDGVLKVDGDVGRQEGVRPARRGGERARSRWRRASYRPARSSARRASRSPRTEADDERRAAPPICQQGVRGHLREGRSSASNRPGVSQSSRAWTRASTRRSSSGSRRATRT